MLFLRLLHVQSRLSGFLVASPCFTGGSCKTVPFRRFPSRLPCRFSVAGKALGDILTCLQVSKVVCVAGAILLCRFWKISCVFRGSRSTMVTSMVILRGRCTSDVSCCEFFTHRIDRDAANGDNVQIPWQAWRFVRFCRM
jgi:hypothetical protein